MCKLHYTLGLGNSNYHNSRKDITKVITVTTVLNAIKNSVGRLTTIL